MIVFLSIVSLGAVLLIMLGRFIQPYSQRKPFTSWSLNDYGAHIVRGLSVFLAAGQRSAYRMDRLHEEAGRDPKKAPEGLRIIDGPYLDDPDDPRGKLNPIEDGDDPRRDDRRPNDPRLDDPRLDDNDPRLDDPDDPRQHP